MDPDPPANLTTIIVDPNELRVNVWLSSMLLFLALFTIKIQLQSGRFKLPWWIFFSAGKAFYHIQFVFYLISPTLYAVDNLWYAVDRAWYLSTLLPFDSNRATFKCIARAVYVASSSIPVFYFVEILEYNRVPTFLFGEPYLPSLFFFAYGIQLALSYLCCYLTFHKDIIFLLVTTCISIHTTLIAIVLTVWERNRSIRHMCKQPLGYTVYPERKYTIKVIAMVLSQSLAFVLINLLGIYFYLNNYQQWEIPHAAPFLSWSFSLVVDWLQLDLWYCPTNAQRINYWYQCRARTAPGLLVRFAGSQNVAPAVSAPRPSNVLNQVLLSASMPCICPSVGIEIDAPLAIEQSEGNGTTMSPSGKVASTSV